MDNSAAFKDALYTMEEVLSMEAKVKGNVWVLAPDIALGPQVFKSVMRDNMKNRGIRYKYLLSDDQNSLDNLVEFISDLDLGKFLAQFEIRILPSAIFEGDITILDPNTPQEYGYVCTPCEVEGFHWRLVGSALFRTKQRFTDLWRLADPVVFADGNVAYPIKDKTPRGFLSLAWNFSGGPRGRFLEQWEAFGLKGVESYYPDEKRDPRQMLLNILIHKYSSDPDLIPPFKEIVYPDPIKETATRIHSEAIASHLAGATSASIGMCGKLLEICLRYYYESRTDETLDENIGLGNLIKKVVERFSVQLDEGLKVLVNFINMYRIAGVHHKKGFEVPTQEQSSAVLMMTYDTIRKLF